MDEWSTEIMDAVERVKLPLAEPPEVLLRRHLGLPNSAPLAEDVRAGIAEASAWFAERGSFWCGLRITNWEGITSERVQAVLREAQCPLAVVAGITAGSELDAEVTRRWSADRPLAAMCLSAYGISLVEDARVRIREALTATLLPSGLSVLPHYSPGYEGWDLADQTILHAALTGLPEPVPIRLLASGGLDPVKSTLCLFGTTAVLTPTQLERVWDTSPPTLAGLKTSKSAFSERALKKWSAERLSWEQQDGQRLARFRTTGSTCSNLGMPLSMEYRVHLSTDPDPVIEAMSCAPAEGDKGFESTCLYLNNPERFREGLADLPPLHGRLLSEAATWQPDICPAGCLCTAANRAHKWRVVLETIAYALRQ